MPLKYIVKPLGPQHNRAVFSSGVDALDRYLREQAGQERRRDVTAVHVLVLPDTSEIIGYYTLSATAIEPTGLPPDVVKRLPRYPTLPAFLVGRLTVAQQYQGKGIGRTLLMSALGRCLAAREHFGAVGVVVDAKDDAARTFYEKYGFLLFQDNPYRLILFMKTIQALVGE